MVIVNRTHYVEKRFVQHNRGYNRSTKAYCPWILFFYEMFETREKARAREVYLKSGVGKEYIKSKWSGSSVG